MTLSAAADPVCGGRLTYGVGGVGVGSSIRSIIGASSGGLGAASGGVGAPG